MAHGSGEAIEPIGVAGGKVVAGIFLDSWRSPALYDGGSLKQPVQVHTQAIVDQSRHPGEPLDGLQRQASRKAPRMLQPLFAGGSLINP